MRADNTADFIYGSRLLLSCDLTGSTAARTHGNAAKNAEKRGREREKESKRERSESVQV